MKLGHDAEMARMQQNNNENTKACNSAMTANAQQRMNQNPSLHRLASQNEFTMHKFSICATFCGCCCRKSEEVESRDGNAGSQSASSLINLSTETTHRSSLMSLMSLTPGQTARRLRGKLEGMRQRKENELASQRKTVAAASRLHQARMDDMKLGHDAEMARMQRINNENTKACNSAMAKMAANSQQRMNQNMADHTANITEMRRVNHGVKVKRNERVNVLKLANAQRVINMEQRLEAQCSDIRQRQHTGKLAHSQRIKMLSFSHVGMADDARNRNAMDLEALRKKTNAKRRAQQKRVDAAKQRHHENIDSEEERHGQAMSDLKSTSDAKTAKHNAGMVRIRDKSKHKSEDVNHMALEFISLENKLKQSEARCAVHQRTLAENAQAQRTTQNRRDLLIAQSQLIVIIKAAMSKSSTEEEKQETQVKKQIKKLSCVAELERFLLNEIKCARNTNDLFGEEMAAFLDELSETNAQMMND